MKWILLLLSAVVTLKGHAQTTTTLVPLQAVWKYLDNGSNQGTAWLAPAFDDSAWSQGPGQLGYGDGDEATVVGYGPNSSAKFITTYFRKSFTVTGAAAYTAAALRVRRDDGVVIYLNGTEVYRNNLPTGTISYTTPAPSAIGGADESALQAGTVNPAMLVEGTNVLAVEIHQQSGTSSDISFDMELTATSTVNDPPVADSQDLTTPEDTALTITVSGSDLESHYGTLADYTQQLYNGSLTGVVDGLSGATWNENTGTLFLIRNVSGGGGTSYEYTADGTLLRTITQSGFEDTEAIEWMYGDTYAIAEENNFQRITICTIPPGATTLDRTAAGNVTWATPVGSLLNLGIESLCYDAGRDLLYYTVEKPSGGAWNIYAMDPETGVSQVLCNVNASIATAGVATDIGDMAFDRATDTILLVSHESSKVIRIDRAGAVLEQRGFTTAFTQAEALALTPDRLRMFIGGEPTQFARYALPANTLTYAVVTPPAHGSLSGLPPRLTYMPVPDYYGPDSFTFCVHDGTVSSAAATVNLTVTPANDAPDGSGASLSAEAGEPTLMVLPVSDPDGDLLTIQATAPAHGTLTLDGVTATYTADAAFTGADGFSYTVSDGTLTAGPFAVDITVLPLNAAPVAQDQTATLDEDTPVPLVLIATDAENDPLTWSVLTSPAHGTLSGTPPNLTFTPEDNFHGADSFTFRVSDGQENSNTATVGITIDPVNDAPVAQAANGSIEAGAPLPLTIAATDVDGDALTFSIAEQPAHGTLTGTPPNLIYTADIAWSGPDSFTFTASDATLTSLPAAVSITVAPYNEPPAAEAGSVTTDEDTPAAVTLAATDPESQPLIYAITAAPGQGTLSGTAPNLTFTPFANANGSDSFTWTASDGSKTSAPATCSIIINPVNDAPEAQSLTISTESDLPAPVTLAGTDIEGAPLTFTIVTMPAHGTLTGTAPALTYTPEAGYTGADGFTFTVSDGELDSTSATATVSVIDSVLDTLVAAGSAWKYLDNGSNQGTAWRDPEFDDAAWAQGPAELGYGDGDEARVISYGPDANNRYLTSYFRREFELPNPGIITAALKLDLLRDDGAVVYLNGTEVFRSNMPTGTVAWNTLASSSIGAPAESTFFSSSVSSSLLVPGRNVLAVEVHQGALNSTDLSFDLRLYESQPVITRGPYVQMTGTDRATVRWRTDVATTSKLDYGPVTTALTSTFSSAALKTEHEITLTGLTPDTRYYYAAGSSSGALVSGSTYYFTTHPPVGTARPYRFWVLGDPGTGDGNQAAVRNAFYSWNGAQELAGVLVLGDTVYETGTDLEFQTKFFDMYPTTTRNTTIWPTFGNHDAGSASSATQSGPYYDSFTMPKFGEVGGVASGTEAYYSFDVGNIHFVCLDSQGTSRLTTGNMAGWLEQDLSATTQEWIVAYWHHPPYSKGSHDSDNPTADGGRMKDMREVFVPILENHGVDLLLFGHEHNYQRSKFIDGHYGVSSTFDSATMVKQTGLGDPAGDGAYVKSVGPHNGAVFTVAGSAGKLTVATLNHAAMAVNRTELGSVVLDVNGRELVARFLNSTGVIRDTFSIVHNTAPVSTPVTVTGNEDTALAVTLLASDAEDDALTYEVVTPPAVGTLTGTAPNLIFTPPANFNGTTGFEFRVHDGRVNSAPVTVTLNILPVNDAPLAIGQSVTTTEDTLAPIVLAGTDADGDALTFTITSLPAHGALAGVLPDVTFIPDADWNGADSFAFTVSDATDTSAAVAITLTVTAVNDAPVAIAGSIDSSEDTPAAITLEGTDVEGDTLTFNITAPPAHGTLSGTSPDIIYTPEANWQGEDSFSFTASDGTDTSVPAVVSLTIHAVNDVPLAAAQSLSGEEDSILTATLSGVDADGDALTFTITALPAHGALTGVLPDVTFIPDADWNGSDSFAFTVSDGTDDSLPAVVALNVTPVNDAPVAGTVNVTTDEDTPVAAILTATDPEGDALTFTVVTSPAHGILSGDAPNLTYTPDTNWHGEDSFSFLANDSVADSAPGIATIIVAPVNDAPLAAAQSITTGENTAAAVTLAGSDPDGDALTFTVTVPPAQGTLSGSAPNLTYTPEANWNGADSLTFTVSDGTAVSAPATVSITVAPVNNVPLAVPQSLATGEDTALPVGLAGSDADGDVLTFTVTVLPAHGTLSGTAPALTYTPEPDWNGMDSFGFTVSDGVATSAAAAVSITVTPVNDGPVAAALVVTTGEDTPGAVLLTASDIEGDALGFAIITPPAHGSLSGTAPELVYSPAANWNGEDTFTFEASDGTAVSTGVVSITVTPVNDLPAAAAQSLATDEDTAAAVTIAGSDVDGDALTYIIVSPPAHGTLTGTPPEFTFAPAANYHGPDSFTFLVNDGQADSAVASVDITVSPVNDLPLAVAQSLSGAEDNGIAVTLTGSDADGDALTFTVTTLPAHGALFGVLPDVTFIPDADWNGADSFSFTVSDATGTSPSAAVALTVSPVNDAPVAGTVAATMDEDTTAAVILSATDIEGDALTFTVITPPAHGTLSGAAPNLSHTPDANWYGEDSFTFLASDGMENSVPGSATITVVPVNDAPLAAAQAVSTTEDTVTVITLQGSDPDGDALTFTITVPPAHGSLSGAAPDLSYTPDANWSGADSFGFTVADAAATSAPASVSITVAPLNNPPVATAVNVTTEVGVPVAVNLTGSDEEGSPLTWNITALPGFGTLSGSGSAQTYTPNLAWSGTDQFTFTVSDGTATSAAATATITVASSGPWQLVARTGNSAPGAGGAVFSLFQPDYVSDAAGRASFRGTAGSITGIWTEGASGLQAVVAQTAAAPGVSGGVFDSVTTGPWAAGDGELLVFGKLLTGAGGVTSSNDLGYWLRSGDTASLIAREDGAVPGMAAAARFSVLSNVASLESGGNYAFAATMKTNSSLGITTANDTGLWATFGAPARLLVRENNTAPGAGSGLFDTLTTAGLVSNGQGQLGFSSALKVAGSITTANRFGLWLWDPAQFGLVARGANAAPGTPAGAVFAQPQNPSFGDAAMTFRSTLTTGTGGVTTSNDTGLWILESGVVTLLAREGFQAPGVATGGLFNGFTEGAPMNGGNELAFRTALRTGSGVTSANNAGIWVRSRFTANALALVARKGIAAPGAGTAIFASFDLPFIADDGGEVFTASLKTGTGGVNASNDRGLWLRNAAGSLALALREGTYFTLAPGDVRIISSITLPATRSSGRTPLSEEGRLLVLLGFTDSSTALYHYTLP